MQLSPNFALDEFIVSQTATRRGIDNTPSAIALHHLELLAGVLEEIRGDALDDKPIFVSSGYRSFALNAAVGGVGTSAHLDGRAADIVCRKFGSPYKIAKAIAAAPVMERIDQLILEFDAWVHVGIAPPNTPPRRQQLTYRSGPGGRVKVMRGIVARR